MNENRQEGQEFFNQKHRTLLGFGIYYREDNKIKCLNIDVISDIIEQTGFTVVSSFRYTFYLK